MAGMKARHFIALGLALWYLMIPPSENPFDPSDRVLITGAPLSQWLVVDSFDTAQQCHQMLAGKTERARRAVVEARKSKGPSAEVELLTEEKSFDAYSAGQCIASDDPRLKAK